jgi:hypothetical protein
MKITLTDIYGINYSLAVKNFVLVDNILYFNEKNKRSGYYKYPFMRSESNFRFQTVVGFNFSITKKEVY